MVWVRSRISQHGGPGPSERGGVFGKTSGSRHLARGWRIYAYVRITAYQASAVHHRLSLPGSKMGRLPLQLQCVFWMLMLMISSSGAELLRSAFVKPRLRAWKAQTYMCIYRYTHVHVYLCTYMSIHARACPCFKYRQTRTQAKSN